jgi:Myb/SANT-like DNA-binding domain
MRYKDWKWLQEQPGFGWDATTQMVTAPTKVWDDLIASNKKYSWYRLNQLLHIDALETCFDSRQATGEGAKSIQLVKALRSIKEYKEEDQEEEEDEDKELQLQLEAQIQPHSLTLSVEDDDTQGAEIEKLVVRKRKQSQTPDPPTAKRERSTGAAQISTALNNVAQELARNCKQKEIERLNKLPAIDRAVKVLEDQFSKRLEELDISEYTQLLNILQSKGSSSSLSKAEVFLLIKDGSKMQERFVEELFSEIIM